MNPHEALQDLVTIREGGVTDYNLIYATWLQGLWHGNDWFRQIDHDQFFLTYRKAIELALLRPSVRVRIACLKSDPDVILGYAITEKNGNADLLHWVFVKKSWRKMGLAKQLVPSTTSIVTHITKLGLAVKPKAWKFNPFLI